MENGVRSDELLMAYVPFMNHTECVRRFLGTDINIHPTYLCAGGFNKTDSCPGDSGKSPKFSQFYFFLTFFLSIYVGGPIQTFGLINGSDRMVQYGIVASGIGCSKTIDTYPSVYTNIAYYLEWILDNMEIRNNEEQTMEDSEEENTRSNFYFPN